MSDNRFDATNDILRNLTKGKRNKISKLINCKLESETSITEYLVFFLPTSSLHQQSKILPNTLVKSLESNKLSPHQNAYLINQKFFDQHFSPTTSLIQALFEQAKPLSAPPSHKHFLLLTSIEKLGINWQDQFLNQQDYRSLNLSFRLKKTGFIDENNLLSPKALEFLTHSKSKNFEYLKGKLTSQHISLLDLFSSYGSHLDENLYNAVTRSKTPWIKQTNAISWLIKNELLDGNFNPTPLAKSLRVERARGLKPIEFKTIDIEIESFFSKNPGSSLKLLSGSNIPLHIMESRLLRLKVSGLVTENNQITQHFRDEIRSLRDRNDRNKDPPWLVDKRIPSLEELTSQQKNVLLVLATESPYLSENQILAHLQISNRELAQLTRGWLLKSQVFPIEHKAVKCFALNNQKANPVLKEAKIEKPLNGKFQQPSHMLHDFNLWESLQEFKLIKRAEGDKIVKIIHERAIYEQKVSPNDNKGISTPDLVLTTESGAQIAFEYGNYRPEKMIGKVLNFPQKNVVIYTSNASYLEQYISLYNSTIVKTGVEKTVRWFYIPGV